MLRLCMFVGLFLLAGLARSANLVPHRAGCGIAWARIAPGVYVWNAAPDQEVTPANLGHVMPTTVLLHQKRAWVIDPGPSYAQGKRLQAAIYCRWGARVHRVFNTHAHAENVLANAAFEADRKAGHAQIAGNEGTALAMERRCPACLQDLTARVGEAGMKGTSIVLPNQVLRSGQILALGPHHLQVIDMPQAHTQSDMVLWDRRRGIVWVGGLVVGQRLPELAQGTLLGWRVALAHIRALKPKALVGVTVAHGAPGAAQRVIDQTDAYLAHVQQTVLQGMEAGLQVSELPQRAQAPFDQWSGHEQRHGFNLQRAWRELEPAWMDGKLRP